VFIYKDFWGFCTNFFIEDCNQTIINFPYIINLSSLTCWVLVLVILPFGFLVYIVLTMCECLDLHINCKYVVQVEQLWIPKTLEITCCLQPPGPCSKIGFVFVINSCCWTICISVELQVRTVFGTCHHNPGRQLMILPHKFVQQT
jgi:hypothetical protein